MQLHASQNISVDVQAPWRRKMRGNSTAAGARRLAMVLTVLLVVPAAGALGDTAKPAPVSITLSSPPPATPVEITVPLEPGVNQDVTLKRPDAKAAAEVVFKAENDFPAITGKAADGSIPKGNIGLISKDGGAGPIKFAAGESSKDAALVVTRAGLPKAGTYSGKVSFQMGAAPPISVPVTLKLTDKSAGSPPAPESGGTDLVKLLAPFAAIALAIERFWEFIFNLVEALLLGQLNPLIPGAGWMKYGIKEAAKDLRLALQAILKKHNPGENLPAKWLESTHPEAPDLSDVAESATAADPKDWQALNDAAGRWMEARKRIQDTVDDPQYKRLKKGLTMLGSLVMGTLISFNLKLHLLAAANIPGLTPDPDLDCLLTGLFIGAGSEPVHQVIELLQSLRNTVGGLATLTAGSGVAKVLNGARGRGNAPAAAASMIAGSQAAAARGGPEEVARAAAAAAAGVSTVSGEAAPPLADPQVARLIDRILRQ